MKGIKRWVVRKDGIKQRYTFKNVKTLKKAYSYDKSGRIWVSERYVKAVDKAIPKPEPRKREPTVKEKAEKKFEHQKDALAELKAVGDKLSQFPTIKEVIAMIDKKLVNPYEQEFSHAPNLQDSYRMYRKWLKDKKITDEKKIQGIISVSSRTLQHRVRAWVTLYDRKGNYLGYVTVYGIEPHKINNVLDEITNIQYTSRENVDSPGKLGEKLRDMNTDLKGKRIARSIKYAIQDEQADYRISSYKIKFDFA